MLRILQQVGLVHRTVRFLMVAVGPASLTAAAEALGTYEARALSLLGLVRAVRAPGTLFFAVSTRRGRGESSRRAGLTSFVDFADVLEVLPSIACD